MYGCRFLRKVSLTADTVPDLLHLTQSQATVDSLLRALEAEPELAQQAAEPAEPPLSGTMEASVKLHGPRSADSPGISPVGGAEAPGISRQGTSGTMWSLTPELDFDEFLERQRAFVEVHSQLIRNPNFAFQTSSTL